MMPLRSDRYSRRAVLECDLTLTGGSIGGATLAAGEPDHVRWAVPVDPWVDTPTVVDDAVYINGRIGNTVLHVLDRDTGEQRGELSLDGVINTRAATTVIDGTAYVVAYRSSYAILLAVDAHSAAEQWRYELP